MVELVEVKFQTKLPQHLPTNRRLTKYVHLKMPTSLPTQSHVDLTCEPLCKVGTLRPSALSDDHLYYN